MSLFGAIGRLITNETCRLLAAHNALFCRGHNKCLWEIALATLRVHAMQDTLARMVEVSARLVLWANTKTSQEVKSARIAHMEGRLFQKVAPSAQIPFAKPALATPSQSLQALGSTTAPARQGFTGMLALERRVLFVRATQMARSLRRHKQTARVIKGILEIRPKM